MVRFILIIALVAIAAFLLFSWRMEEKKPEPVPVPIAIDSAKIEKPKSEFKLPIVETDNPEFQQLLNEYEQYIQKSMEKNAAPGVAVAIVQDTSILFIKGFGVRDAANDLPVDIHTVFRLGSVSKCFASILTGALVQKRVFQWDDSVVKFLPQFELKSKEHADALTLRHILSHTTGLPYHAYTVRLDEGISFDTLVSHLRELDLFGKPGKIYSYQNVGYSLIGDVIKSATGLSYSEAMQQHVFNPLHMDQASMSFEAMVGNENKALPHRNFIKRWKPMAISETYYDVGPAGGVNASIADMALLMRALVSMRLPDTTSQEEIFRPYVRAPMKNRHYRAWKRPTGSYYGLGWRVLRFKDDTLHYHGGYVNYYRSEVALLRKEKIGISILVNTASPFADHAIPEFFKMYEKRRKAIREWELKKKGAVLATVKK
ncbi:MAG: beta-lactamase family protein [Cyclobacteriaceae bacterium]|nr:beta-lactamase family protein [Cyclobacteriaceae bacterium]